MACEKPQCSRSLHASFDIEWQDLRSAFEVHLAKYVMCHHHQNGPQRSETDAANAEVIPLVLSRGQTGVPRGVSTTFGVAAAASSARRAITCRNAGRGRLDVD